MDITDGQIHARICSSSLWLEGPKTWPANDPCNEILPPINGRALGRPKSDQRKLQMSQLRAYLGLCLQS
jgi:hypothetical protein